VKQECEVSLLHADVARLQQHNATQNTITALQNQLSQMSINPPVTSNTPHSNNTITCTPMQTTMGYPQSTFTHQPNTAPQPLVVMEELKTAVRQLVALYTHHQDTAARRMAYAAQIAQWNAKWGENMRVTQETGYPLKPVSKPALCLRKDEDSIIVIVCGILQVCAVCAPRPQVPRPRNLPVESLSPLTASSALLCHPS